MVSRSLCALAATVVAAPFILVTLAASLPDNPARDAARGVVRRDTACPTPEQRAAADLLEPVMHCDPSVRHAIPALGPPEPPLALEAPADTPLVQRIDAARQLLATPGGELSALLALDAVLADLRAGRIEP